MAPGRRGRPKKVGLSRMDAAVQAMNLMGFESQTIRRKVKELLKEYGGNEGWIFIEDCSYSVLLDSLLDEQNMKSGPPLLMDAASQNEIGEPSSVNQQSQELAPSLITSEADFIEPSAVLPSSEQIQEKQMVIGSAAEENETVVSSFIETENTAPLLSCHDTQSPRATEAGVNMNQDEVAPDQIKHMLPILSDEKKLGVQGSISAADDSDQSNGVEPVPHPPPTTSSTWQTIQPHGAKKTLSRCKRKLCYGWVGSDENDYVLLPLMEVYRSKPWQRRVYESKWDVK